MKQAMTDPATHAHEQAIAAVIAEAAAAREPLLIRGNGTKSGMLRAVQAARTLSATDNAGITLYAPKELIISARAGTPLPIIEAELAANGQRLIAEPPDLAFLPHPPDVPQTLGGVVAANLSGPRRVAWGAMRDHVMGVRAVTGRGEAIHSGGRVLKNVTGLDLCKLFTGSHGTLGVLTEVTLKVLPAPEATGTLVLFGRDAVSAVAALSAALGSPFGVSAAAWLPAELAGQAVAGATRSVTLIRIEDFAASVRYRLDRLFGQLGAGNADLLDDAASRAVWRAVGSVAPLPVAEGEAVWRVSVRPSAGPGVLAALAGASGVRGFLDWGGGLVWLAGPATTATHDAVAAAVRAANGVWTLMRAPDGLRGAVDVVPEEAEPLARVTRRLKGAFDPAGILNPGRIYAGL
jgi:glycolate oxidase FAD binding subunit